MTLIPPADAPVPRRLTTPFVSPRAQAVPDPVDSVTVGLPVAEAARILQKATASNGSVVLWQVDTGQGRTQVCLVGRRLFVSGWGPDIRAVSDAGVERWKRPTSVKGEPVRLAASPYGDLFAVGPRKVEAFDADGERAWAVEPSRSLSSACAVGPEGNLYVTDKLHLMALSPSDGHVLWSRSHSPARRDAPPVVGPDGTVYYATANDALIAFAPDGTERWRYAKYDKLGEPFFPDIATIPGTDAEGSVYFQSRDGLLHKLDRDGNEAWSKRFPSAPHPELTPQIDGRGHLQIVAGSELVTLDPATGERLRTTPLDGTPTHLAASPRGGAVIAFEDGRLRSWDAEGTSTWTLPATPIESRPIYGPDGELYVTSDERLLCLAPLDTYDPKVPEAPPAGTISDEDGFIIIGDVRVPKRA